MLPSKFILAEQPSLIMAELTKDIHPFPTTQFASSWTSIGAVQGAYRYSTGNLATSGTHLIKILGILKNHSNNPSLGLKARLC